MQDYISLPERRYPSPSAQRRSGEHWKARVGLGFVVILTLCSSAVMFRVAGMGVGSAASTLRGPAATAPAARTPPPAGPAAAGQQPGGQAPAAAAPAGQAPAAATATPQPAATATPAAASPTARPGQREHTVQAGDTLSAIATRYSTTVDAIVAANNLRSRDTILSIGQRLIIP